jgi:hypothetical protein
MLKLKIITILALLIKIILIKLFINTIKIVF